MDRPMVAVAVASPTLDSAQEGQAPGGKLSIGRTLNYGSLPPKLDKSVPRDGCSLRVPTKVQHKTSASLPPLLSERSSAPTQSEFFEESIHRASVWRDYQQTGKVLGKGGLSAHVMEGVHKVTDELVAIKTMERKKLSLRQSIDLNREVHCQQLLDHPHVAKLKGVYKTKKHVRLVIEHLAGGTVWSLFKKRGPFSERETAVMIMQVLEAVAHMHDKGIVHRDIKLENVVYESSQRNKVKVIDFGLAALWDKGMPPLARVCGTPSCVAPEVLASKYTNKVDLWCVGVMAHKLLTGEDHQMLEGTSVVMLSKNLRSCSPEAQKFVTALLSVNEKVRPSAQDALLLPWLQVFARPSTTRSNIPNGSLETFGSGTLTSMNVTEVFLCKGPELQEHTPDSLDVNWSVLGARNLRGNLREEEYEQSTSHDGAAMRDLAQRSRWSRQLPGANFMGRRMTNMWAALRGTKATRISPEMTPIVPGSGDT